MTPSPDAAITEAAESDLEAILDLQRLAYQSEARLFPGRDIPPLRQTLQEVRAEFAAGVFLKAVDGRGRIVGSVRARCDGGTVQIGKLMVHPECQRKGLGARLLLAVEAALPNRRYELFTSTRSVRNIALYERLGYRRFCERALDATLRLVYLEKEETEARIG